GQALLVHESRDAEPSLTFQSPLLRPQPRRAIDRIDGARAVDARVVPDAVASHLGEIARRLLPRGHLALHRRHESVLVEPVAHDLRELLFEAHGGVQRSDAIRDRGHGRNGVGHDDHFRSQGWSSACPARYRSGPVPRGRTSLGSRDLAETMRPQTTRAPAVYSRMTGGRRGCQSLSITISRSGLRGLGDGTVIP